MNVNSLRNNLFHIIFFWKTFNVCTKYFDTMEDICIFWSNIDARACVHVHINVLVMQCNINYINAINVIVKCHK